MPAKRKAAARGRKEATDSDDEPKSKRARPVKSKPPAPKPRAKKSGPYKMPPPFPTGEVLTDIAKHSWRLGESIGRGGFGEIYRATPVGSAEDANHVIKIEPQENGPLFSEIAFYCRAAKEEMISGWVAAHKLAYLPIPKYIAQGRHCRAGLTYRFMVMHCFGEDVEKKFSQCGRQFGIKTVCHLALRILEALQYLHESEYAHGDIKGSNLLTGLHPSQRHEVYLVDYGLACRYRPQGKHKEYKEDPRRKHDGTLEFTSIDAHKGVTPSARGDLEILAYCLLQWSSGHLPWEQHVKDEDKDAVASMKIRYKSDVAGLMKACFPSTRPPVCLRDYMTYVNSLGYDASPDYARAKQIFVRELGSHRYRDDGKNLDWITSPTKRKGPPVAEECDSLPTSPPKRRKLGVSSRQKQKPETVPLEPDTASKRKAPVRATARGKQRKVESSDSIEVAKPIACNGSSSDGEEPDVHVVMPCVSYPKALGYEENGLVEQSSSKRHKSAVRKKPRTQQRQSRASPKKTSPVQRRTRKNAKVCTGDDADREKDNICVKHRT